MSVSKYTLVAIRNALGTGVGCSLPDGCVYTIELRFGAILHVIIPAAILLTVSLTSGCKGCGEGNKIAELISTQNNVFRDFASKTEKWQKASEGEEFTIGDGLKTDKNATARLHLLPKGKLVVKGDTIIRFQSDPSGDRGQRLHVETGSIEIESQEIDIQVDTVVGLSRIGKGSRVRIRSTKESSSFDVLVGSITVDSQGKTLQVASGERLELDVGDILIDEKEKSATNREVKESDESTAVAEPPDETEAESSADNGFNSDYDQAPTVADVTILPGESAIIHDPAPPTNVRIPIRDCENGGIAEVGASGRGGKSISVRGDSDAILRLPKGTHRYRVRCLKDGKPERSARVRGRLSIVRDAAIRRLPKDAPAVQIDADGRPYTVRYQNLLPRITFRWPDPAVSKVYTFHIKSGRRKTQTRNSSHPETVYRSGQLSEGSHTFYFSTTDGRRSANGRLRIAFDNTARTAYISDPVEGTPTPGQTVRVVGSALARSEVSVDGRTVSIDSQGRFQTETVASNKDGAIAIRVQRKSTDIHYYLRHLSSNK